MVLSVKVWLIGGTSDSREIAKVLSDRQISWVATVVTNRAQRLYHNLPGTVHVGSLMAEDLPGWLEHHGITHIVDASHPFATEISRLAIATSLPYLRYERPALDLIPIVQQNPNIATFQTWEHLFRAALQHNHPRILLTTGLKVYIRQFQCGIGPSGGRGFYRVRGRRRSPWVFQAIACYCNGPQGALMWRRNFGKGWGSIRY